MEGHFVIKCTYVGCKNTDETVAQILVIICVAQRDIMCQYVTMN